MQVCFPQNLVKLVDCVCTADFLDVTHDMHTLYKHKHYISPSVRPGKQQHRVTVELPLPY